MLAHDLRGHCFDLTFLHCMQIPLASRYLLCNQLQHLFSNVKLREVDVGGVDVHVVREDLLQLLTTRPSISCLKGFGYPFQGTSYGTSHHTVDFSKVQALLRARGDEVLRLRSWQPGPSATAWTAGWRAMSCTLLATTSLADLQHCASSI